MWWNMSDATPLPAHYDPACNISKYVRDLNAHTLKSVHSKVKHATKCTAGKIHNMNTTHKYRSFGRENSSCLLCNCYQVHIVRARMPFGSSTVLAFGDYQRLSIFCSWSFPVFSRRPTDWRMHQCAIIVLFSHHIRVVTIQVTFELQAFSLNMT